MEVDFLDLRLSTSLTLDTRDSRALAHRLLIVDTLPSEADMSAEAIAALASETRLRYLGDAQAPR